jgi:hypothetical protein
VPWPEIGSQRHVQKAKDDTKLTAALQKSDFAFPPHAQPARANEGECRGRLSSDYQNYDVLIKEQKGDGMKMDLPRTWQQQQDTIDHRGMWT